MWTWTWSGIRHELTFIPVGSRRGAFVLFVSDPLLQDLPSAVEKAPRNAGKQLKVVVSRADKHNRHGEWSSGEYAFQGVADMGVAPVAGGTHDALRHLPH